VKFLEKIMTVVETVFTAIAALCTALMMLLTSADAFSRYALNSPLLGAYEITEKYLMVAAIFLGLAYAYHGGAFIRVTFLVDRLSGSARLAADYFAYLVTLGFALVIMYATAQQSLRSLNDATTLNTLPIPTGPAYCIVPLGFLAMTLLLIADLPRIRTRQSALFATDAPSA
jgi:TRAP-type C4-dicarboxylate transport system permease small subunit